MWTHLQLVNLCIGMQKGFGSLPTPFWNQAYDLAGVGVGFTLSDGAVLCPDVLFHAAQRRRSLLVEAKAGASFDADQLARYRRCTSADIRDRAFCHILPDGSHAVEPLYIVNEDHAESILASCDRAGTAVPLLSVSATGYRLVGPQMSDAALDVELRSGVAFSAEDFPSRFFMPIDNESSPSEGIDVVLAEVVAMLVGGLTRFKPEDVVARMVSNINPEVVRGIGSGSPVKGMNRVVRAILDDVAANEFSAWIEPAGNQDFFKVKQAISRVDRQARVRGLRSLRAAMRKSVARVRSGERQLPLFGE